MNKKLVLLGAAVLLTTGSVFAQKRVTGRVADAEGNPIVGASVRYEGQKGVVLTDDNGRFTLTNVPASAKKIKVSYIGKETKTLSVAGNLDVTLEDNDQTFGEAVVVGYGTAKKIGTVVGSVTTVGADKIENKPVANAIDALQGQVAGLNVLSSSGDPGASLSSGGFSAVIRGTGSLSASNTPLFVVDGVPTSSSVLGMMNPNDIANVTVLKGASATSIYGSRASNGVIYITTKSGSLSERAEVTVSQSIGWSSLARGIGDPMNANELLDLKRELGLISGSEYISFKEKGINTDWLKYYYRDDAAMYQTNFSIRGGNAKTKYYTSASYFKQDGIMAGSAFKRITFRTNLDSKPLDWLSYGTNISVSYDRRRTNASTSNGTNYIYGGTMGAALTDPNYSPYDENGNRLDYFNTPFGNMSSPEYIAKSNPRIYNDVRTISSGYININPVKGLNVRSQLSLDGIITRGSLKLYPSSPSASGYGAASESYSRSIDWTITNTAEYKFTIADKHHFTLLAGQEGIRGTDEGFNAATQGQSNDKITTLGNGLENNGLAGSSESEYQYLSFFGRADYSLGDKYFLNFSVRNDKSSRFGINGKSATFFSGGAMWDMKRESFLDQAWWLNELQVRADVGSTGNSAIGDYDHLALLGNSQYGANYGYVFSSPGNDDLKWEKQIQTGVGFNARLFDRATVSFTWYNRTTKDMLMSVPIAYSTGFSSKVRNVGSMENRGIEIEFGVDVVRWNGLTVNLHGNYNYNKNKITELFNGLNEWYYSGTSVKYIVGEAPKFFMPIFAGVDKEDGKEMWYKQGYTGDPVHEYNPETMTKEFNEDALNQNTGKNVNPPHVGGFGMTASWKGFTLNADFNFVLGKYMMNNDRYFSENPGTFLSQGANQDKAVLDMWRKPGDITLIPGYVDGGTRQFDTHLLENASFMRLKNISLSYDLPKTWMDATGFFKNVRITATGRNLFTVTKYKGADPEVNANLSLNTFPNTRQFTIGAEVTF